MATITSAIRASAYALINSLIYMLHTLTITSIHMCTYMYICTVQTCSCMHTHSGRSTHRCVRRATGLDADALLSSRGQRVGIES